MAPCRNKSRATSVVAKEAALSAKKVDAFVTVLDSLFLQNSLSLSKYEIEKSSLKMGILCKTLVSPPIPISGYFSYIRTLFQNVFFSSTHQPDEDERGPMKRGERERKKKRNQETSGNGDGSKQASPTRLQLQAGPAHDAQAPDAPRDVVLLPSRDRRIRKKLRRWRKEKLRLG